MQSAIVSTDFKTYRASVPEVLDALDAGPRLAARERILIKPNLVNDSPPPVTTPVECCAALVEYIRAHSSAAIIIAEGCGAAEYDTARVFERLGYNELAARYKLELVDLNLAPTLTLKRPDCRIFPEFHLPAIARQSYIISVPVLKAHSLAEITGTLKNMLGFAPPAHYQCGGHWKKSAFHARMHQSIVELNRYVTPHLTLLDASVGLAEYHLGGPACDPPVGKLLAGYDPLAMDRQAARLLNRDWRAILHLAAK